MRNVQNTSRARRLLPVNPPLHDLGRDYVNQKVLGLTYFFTHITTNAFCPNTAKQALSPHIPGYKLQFTRDALPVVAKRSLPVRIPVGPIICLVLTEGPHLAESPQTRPLTNRTCRNSRHRFPCQRIPKMAAAIKALNAKIRSNKYTDYFCSTRRSYPTRFHSLSEPHARAGKSLGGRNAMQCVVLAIWALGGGD
jgi:hypothetical protein